ncbi:hypothetical protein F5148DRAFT_600908 [Russula earlei]|uniref:Uncharacterized protein n=1 Tax=Russula earlei TaxID=71964 RepID=A0ACC0TXD2_9AGAM|nr:hypothetical protein F5148DRAFT_600908 [Russula earlei]
MVVFIARTSGLSYNTSRQCQMTHGQVMPTEPDNSTIARHSDHHYSPSRSRAVRKGIRTLARNYWDKKIRPCLTTVILGRLQLCEKRPQIASKSEPRKSSIVALGEAEQNDAEVDEVLSLPRPTLPETIKLIARLWECELNDSVPFLVSVNRMQRLVAEWGGSEGEEVKRNALEERARLDDRWQRGHDVEEIRVDSDSENVCSMTQVARSSNVSSMICPLHPVRRVKSLKEPSRFRPPCRL